MNIFKTFTFWFAIFSTFVCLFNYFGYDDKNLLFFIFGLEPILYKAVYTEPFRSWIIANGDILWVGHMLRIFTGLFYGIILDLIVFFIRKKL
jgi:hypothetical protein